MDLTIHQNCPSCGADIELSEADRLIRCPYCDVQNFMVTRGALRFVLPDKAPDHILRRNMLYAPYLRFKGNIYYCKGKYLKHKVVDTTQLGTSGTVLPPSLGLRPQAMPVSLVTDAVEGHFLRQTIKAKTLLERAAQLTVIASEDIDAPFYHRAYIGETVSCIYLPLYLQNDLLYDAVTNTVLGKETLAEKMRAQSMHYKTAWSPHFLATLCPRCGDTLSGAHDSLILSCYNCQSCWEETKNGFQSISWNAVVSNDKGMYYLPFWKLSVRADGIDMRTFADFLRITNQPLVIQKRHKELGLHFLLPAFKLRPSTFLRLGKNMTLSQERLPQSEQQMPKRMHPVTLKRIEALQALKSVLAGAAVNKRTLLPKLPIVRFHSMGTELSYLPFKDKGHDFVQEQTGIPLAQSVLRLGRKL